MRKREEKEAAEALKREQELREAKRQQQRFNFLLSQTDERVEEKKKKRRASPCCKTKDEAVSTELRMLLPTTLSVPALLIALGLEISPCVFIAW